MPTGGSGGAERLREANYEEGEGPARPGAERDRDGAKSFAPLADLYERGTSPFGTTPPARDDAVPKLELPMILRTFPPRATRRPVDRRSGNGDVAE
jgi:hypothetical protein